MITSGGGPDPAPDARPAPVAAAGAAATAATDGTRMEDTEREPTLCGGGGNSGERSGGDGDNDDEPTTTTEMTVVSASIERPHTNTGADDDSSAPGPAPDATPEASSIISGCSEPPPESSPPPHVGDGGGGGGGAPSHGVKKSVTEEEGTGELAWAAGEEPKPKAIKRPTGRSKGRAPKTIDVGGSSTSGDGRGVPKGSSVSRSQALDLVEDDVLHAREQEAQTGDGATAEPPLRPPRPTPVNRLRVPAGAVGDLLTVRDFLKVLAWSGRKAFVLGVV